MFPFLLAEPALLLLSAIVTRSVFSKEPFDPLDPFSLREKKEKSEERAEKEDDIDSLAAKYDDDGAGSAVDDELAALKAKMGL